MLPDDTDFVIVHDGVRPFVTDEMIFTCLEAAADWGAAVVAVPVKDTIKITDRNGFVIDTPDRSQLWGNTDTTDISQGSAGGGPPTCPAKADSVDG